MHALVADGVFSPTGTLRVLPPIPNPLLEEQLRHAVLEYLVDDEAITAEFADKLLAWKHSLCRRLLEPTDTGQGDGCAGAAAGA